MYKIEDDHVHVGELDQKVAIKKKKKKKKKENKHIARL